MSKIIENKLTSITFIYGIKVNLKFLSRRVLLALFCTLLLMTTSCLHGKDDVPKVIMKTSKGDVIIELYPDKAPLTVANFIQYIDEKAYVGATFYRATRPDNDPTISVLQGGLWKPWQKDMIKNYKPAFPSISHETTQISGLKHSDGVISMGRFEPGTANSEFFISVGDNASLDFGGDRNPDGQGFAAFGCVIKGMDVIRAIHALPTEIGEGYKGQILVEPIKITNIMLTKH